jgi:hypothetical protein
MIKIFPVIHNGRVGRHIIAKHKLGSHAFEFYGYG